MIHTIKKFIIIFISVNNDEFEVSELPEADQGLQLTNLSETEGESVISANESVTRPSEIDNRPLAAGTGNLTENPAINSQMSFKEVNPRINMSDIKRHEREKIKTSLEKEMKKSVPKRSESLSFLSKPSPILETLGISGTSARGEGSGHNLRKKPKTTFFLYSDLKPKEKDKKK